MSFRDRIEDITGSYNRPAVGVARARPQVSRIAFKKLIAARLNFDTGAGRIQSMLKVGDQG